MCSRVLQECLSCSRCATGVLHVNLEPHSHSSGYVSKCVCFSSNPENFLQLHDPYIPISSLANRTPISLVYSSIPPLNTSLQADNWAPILAEYLAPSGPHPLHLLHGPSVVMLDSLHNSVTSRFKTYIRMPPSHSRLKRHNLIGIHYIYNTCVYVRVECVCDGCVWGMFVCVGSGTTTPSFW